MYSLQKTLTIAICSLLLVVATATAQTDLAKMATDAKADFKPVTKADVTAARAQAQETTAALWTYLSGGGETYLSKWKKYLMATPVKEQLAATEPDLAVLREALKKYSANKPGLDLPKFVAVRKALQQFISNKTLAADKNAKLRYEANIDGLVKALATYADDPTFATREEIGLRIGWLAQNNQAAPLVTAIRKQYNQPNLQFGVSNDFISAGLSRDVDQEAEINEDILGTSVSGKGRLKGRVTASLVPNTKKAEVQLKLTGKVKGNTTGYNGPIVVQSSSNTTVDATKKIFFSDKGLTWLPATANCVTSTTFESIDSQGRFGSRIGQRAAYRRQPAAEAVASERASVRVARNFDKEAAPRLKKSKDNIQEKFFAPLGSRDARPEMMQFSTTTDRLNVTALQATASQLGAPGVVPELDGSNDLNVRVHESCITNAAHSMLAGVELTDERLVEIIEKLKGEVPEELKITDDKDPWSITFTTINPVHVTFSDNTVRIAIRGSQFTRGDQVLKKSVEISALYDIEMTDTGITMTRQGDIQIVFLRSKGKTLSAQQVVFKSFLMKKFGAMFKPEYVGSGWQLKGDWSGVGTMLPKQMKSNAGWLVLGWDRQVEEK